MWHRMADGSRRTRRIPEHCDADSDSLMLGGADRKSPDSGGEQALVLIPNLTCDGCCPATEVLNG